MNTKRRLAIFAGLVFPLITATAGPTYTGTISGVFTAPVLSGNLIALDGTSTPANNTATAVFSGTGTNTFNWGSFASGTNPFSTFVFTGANFVDQPIDEPFILGTFQYTNGTSGLDTVVFGLTLTLSITGTGTFTPDSTNILMLTTANGGVDPFKDADFVSFDKFPNTFNVFENVSASANLIGMIVGDPELHIINIRLVPGETNGFLSNGQGIPEPGSVVLIASGLVALGVLRRRYSR